MPWEITLDDAAAKRAFDALPARLDAELARGVTEGALLVERAVIDRTPVGATGMLRGSITHDVSGVGVNLSGRVFSTDVPVKVAAVETGRAPGRMPPWGLGSALYLWVTRKAGGDQRAAFLIARAIGRRGTKGAHMFEKAFAASKDGVQARLAAAVDRALGER